MASKIKMLLVTDAAGHILAAAHKSDGKSSKVNVGFSPLPGQEIFEVEVPEELTRLKAGHDFHMALSHARFHRATGKIDFPEVNYKRIKH